ncbi:hypothetical protein N9M84_03200, partial [Candidatus Poseidoniales archaeon]|nr:hypothetical protein [Candidatus Poseidoniales archaeon]
RGPENCEDAPDEARTRFSFSSPRKQDELNAITDEEILHEWIPMLRFLDSDVELIINVHGKERQITHTAEVLRDENGYRIIKFETPKFIPKGYFCSSEGCEKRFEQSIPDCPHCESSEHVQEHEAEEVVEVLLAIEAAIDPNEDVSNRIDNLIKEESEFFEQNSAHNPWKNVNANLWYEAKRIRFGVNTHGNPEANIVPWLFSLAEITETEGWLTGRTKLHAETRWCIDGPFFLHPDRKQLDNRSIDAKNGNRELLRQVLSRLVGRLALYMHENGNYPQFPYQSPLDDMLIEFNKDRGTFSSSSTNFSPLIHTQPNDDEEKVLLPYHSVFGGYALFKNANGTLINAHEARRIPKNWLLPDGTPIIDWLSEHSDLENWDKTPVHNDGDSLVLMDESLFPIVSFVEEYDKQEFHSKLNQHGLWEQLISQHPTLHSQEWVRVPLPYGTESIVCATEGWPTALEPLVEVLRGEDVLFTNDDEIVSTFGQSENKKGWSEQRNIKVLTIPNEPADCWWANMLIRHAIDLKVTMPAEFMQSIGQILAHETSEYFVADLEHWRFENYADRLTRSAAGVAIIPVSMPGRTVNEQTYVPSLGRGYSFSGVSASNTLWSNIKSESFDEASDVDHLLYQEGFSSTIDFPNRPFVLVGEPINPAKILGGFIDAINSADTIPTRGGFLFAHPSEGCFNHAKLVSRAWVKLPSITLPVDPDDYELIWGERNEFLGRHEWTNSSWNADWDDRNVCRHVKHYRQSYVGKLMSLYSEYSRKKEIVIRRMHLSNVLNHSEFIQPDDDYDPELSILCELNSGRFSKSNNALRYVRMHRTGQNSDFYLKVAHITTIAQSRNPNLTGNKPRIQRNRLQALIDREICGFSPNIERETVNWIFSIDLDSDELGEELVNQWLEIENRMENVCKIRPLDCSGMSPKSLESNLEG